MDIQEDISITVIAGAFMPLFQPTIVFTSAYENDWSDSFSDNSNWAVIFRKTNLVRLLFAIFLTKTNNLPISAISEKKSKMFRFGSFFYILLFTWFLFSVWDI